MQKSTGMIPPNFNLERNIIEKDQFGKETDILSYLLRIIHKALAMMIIYNISVISLYFISIALKHAALSVLS